LSASSRMIEPKMRCNSTATCRCTWSGPPPAARRLRDDAASHTHRHTHSAADRLQAATGAVPKKRQAQHISELSLSSAARSNSLQRPWPVCRWPRNAPTPRARAASSSLQHRSLAILRELRWVRGCVGSRGPPYSLPARPWPACVAASHMHGHRRAPRSASKKPLGNVSRQRPAPTWTQLQGLPRKRHRGPPCLTRQHDDESRRQRTDQAAVHRLACRLG
jgi:hypothetical protein